MAECHPVGFQWVMEAKARGAKLIHVDPRFTRTSALADMHVPLRAGSDIVFLGGIINYVLANEKYFRDYVVNYTNAATLLTEDFADTEDLDGVFSGLDREHRTYDFEAWRYQGAEMSRGGRATARSRQQRRRRQRRPQRARASGRCAGRDAARRTAGAAAHRNPDRDETLTSPRCVFQVLKRHFARYTPEMVEQACGVPPDAFARVCELVTENSGPDRTTAFVYSVGWTQHTVGVQYIRTAAILQLLLGNIGRPGGGILALRGHASIQGSTDIPTLFDLLPGYLPMPHVHGNEDLAAYVHAESTDKGFWANMGSYTVSLLKSWWGEAATPANDFCFDYLPRLTGSHSIYEIAAAQIGRHLQGLHPDGRELSGRLGERPDAADGPGEPGLAGGAGHGHDRERHLVAERPGDRDRGDAHRGHRHRGVLHARRRAHREERLVHQHAADAAVAPSRRSSRPETRAANCGSCTISAAASGRS